MSNFSVNSCYAVLSAYPDDAPLQAFLRLVVALVDEKKYALLDPQIMSTDFSKRFGFPLPYHPMQEVIQLGIKKKYFEYNSSLKETRPIWDAVDSGEFMKIYTEKETEYNNLLQRFDQFLQEKYQLHSSKEDLSNQVQAFIQRYGLVSKTDKEILKKVQNDYHFAEYMLVCNESGDFEALEYIDKYITGCSFAEVMAFGVSPAEYKSCEARVFLDTGFIFALLGIGSKDRSGSYKTLFNDMIRLGMKPTIFQHTYAEIEGIIDTASSWIGDPNYNPAMASETAYFFHLNNWSYKKARELIGDLRRIITQDLQIEILNPPYPQVADIHTKYEEDIKQLIIDEYTHSNPKFSLAEKQHTIELDARSLFYTLHFDNNNVAYTLPDVKNIFITTNRSLAKVGTKLTAEIVHTSGPCIPIALTDLTWGTLVWANTPAKISSLNRANIISAAYAAFQPSDSILSKLNESLIKHQESGEISPEKCYFLKTNALALRLLAQNTQNDENRYSDQTPFEILKALREEGYEEGLSEKQKEVDKVFEEKRDVEIQLSIERQQSVINELKNGLEKLHGRLASEKEKGGVNTNYIKAMENACTKAEQKIAKRVKKFKIICTIVCLLLGLAIWSIAQSAEWNWLITVATAGVPLLFLVFYIWKMSEVKPIYIVKWATTKISEKTYEEYGFDINELDKAKEQDKQIKERISQLDEEILGVTEGLRRETSKMDKMSSDISLVE